MRLVVLAPIVLFSTFQLSSAQSKWQLRYGSGSPNPLSFDAAFGTLEDFPLYPDQFPDITSSGWWASSTRSLYVAGTFPFKCSSVDLAAQILPSTDASGTADPDAAVAIGIHGHVRISASAGSSRQEISGISVSAAQPTAVHVLAIRGVTTAVPRFSFEYRCSGSSTWTTFDGLWSARGGAPIAEDYLAAPISFISVHDSTGQLRDVATLENVPASASLFDPRFSGDLAASRSYPSGWSICPNNVDTAVCIAGSAFRFGASCLKVAGEAALNTLTGASCTPSARLSTCIWRLSSRSTATVDTRPPTSIPEFSTSGYGTFGVLAGADHRAPGSLTSQGYCRALPPASSDWEWAESGDTGNGPFVNFGALALIGSSTVFDRTTVSQGEHRTAVEDVDYVSFKVASQTFICPTAVNAHILLKKAIPINLENCLGGANANCICKSTGDPHFLTFDGSAFTYMGAREHVLTSGGSGTTAFSVNTFQDFMSTDTGVAFNRILHVTYGGAQILFTQVHAFDPTWATLYSGTTLIAGNSSAAAGSPWIGGNGLSQFPTGSVSFPGGSTFAKLSSTNQPFGPIANGGWQLTLPNDVKVAFKWNTWRDNPHWDIYVAVPASLRKSSNSLKGMCGNCNCDASDDSLPSPTPTPQSQIPTPTICLSCLKWSNTTVPQGGSTGTSATCKGVPVSMLATVRDFKQCHPDMEGHVRTAKGMVETQLQNWNPLFPTRGYPVTAKNASGFLMANLEGGKVSTKPLLKSAESFQSWWGWYDTTRPFSTSFGNIDPTCAQGIVFDDVVIPGAKDENTNICCFENPNFFPVNNKGYGNEGKNQNFWFSMEVRNVFTYTGLEEFYFCGDDDVFVFINNRLFVDLGGVHSKLCVGSITNLVKLKDYATQLALVEGNEYNFDFFFAERHTTQSNFFFQTSCFLKQVQPDDTPLCERLTGPAIEACCDHLPSGPTRSRCVIETHASCECNTQQECEDEFLSNINNNNAIAPEGCPAASQPTNIINYNGADFAVLDNTAADAAGFGCQSGVLSIPAGWTIAHDSATTRAVGACSPFGTRCLAVMSSFSDSYGKSLSFDSNGDICAPDHAILTNGDCYDQNAGCFAVSQCSSRILITRAAPSTQPILFSAWTTPSFTVGASINPMGGKFSTLTSNPFTSSATLTASGVISTSASRRFSLGVWHQKASTGSDANSVRIVTKVDTKQYEYELESDSLWRYAIVDVPIDSASNSASLASVSVSYIIVGSAGTAQYSFTAPEVLPASFSSPSKIVGGASDSNAVSNSVFRADAASAFTIFAVSSNGASNRGAIASDFAAIDEDASSIAFLSDGLSDDGTGHAVGTIRAGEVWGVQQTVSFSASANVRSIAAQFDTKIPFFSYLGSTLSETAKAQAAIAYFDVHYSGAASDYGITYPIELGHGSWTSTNFKWESSKKAGTPITSVVLTIMVKGNQADVQQLLANADGDDFFQVLVDNLSVQGLPCGKDPVVSGSTVGDPHTQTLDGFMYDLHVAGDFILLNAGTMFVSARQVIAFNGLGSINTAALVRFNGLADASATSTTVELYTQNDNEEPVMYIDGAVVPLMGRTSSGLHISVSGSMNAHYASAGVIVRVSSGSYACTIRVTKSAFGVQLLDVVPSLPASSAGQVAGLLGNFDGDLSNDLRTQNGAILQVCSDSEGSAAAESMVNNEAILRSQIQFVAGCAYHPASFYRVPLDNLIASGFVAAWDISSHKVFTVAFSDNMDPQVEKVASFSAEAWTAAQDACRKRRPATTTDFMGCVNDFLASNGAVVSSGTMGLNKFDQNSGAAEETYDNWSYVDSARVEESEPTSTTGATVAVIVCVVAAAVLLVIILVLLVRKFHASSQAVETIVMKRTDSDEESSNSQDEESSV